MRSIALILIGSLLMMSCSIEPIPINYGKDACHYCKMSIVDRQHAAQLITKKGRDYKFDAIECMVNSLPQWEVQAIHSYLIADYSTPAQMIPAQNAYYLISPRINSPMGANLSGFQNENDRNIRIKSSDDKALSWGELLESLTH